MNEEEPQSLDGLLEWCYEEFDLEPSERAKEFGRTVAHLQD